MIVLAGKQRQMRLIPVKALDQPTDTEWIKVADTKNCLTFATGVMRGGQGGKFFCLKILSLANFLVQVNLFQKYLFLHQLTQNMTKDRWLNYQFCT